MGFKDVYIDLKDSLTDMEDCTLEFLKKLEEEEDENIKNNHMHACDGTFTSERFSRL